MNFNCILQRNFSFVILPIISKWLLYVPPGLALKIYFLLPKEYIYVFCTVLRTNIDYFPTPN
jgi:hypothetical protein